jgi:prepilin-type N-terminal cleavage/methylation domain-containing protein
MKSTRLVARSAPAGFSLVEVIVVLFLLAVAMLGILSVFDASARINKNELDIADAQGAVRYGISTMIRAIRRAGAGGLFVTQAVLNHRDPQLPGITVVNGVENDSYDNVGDGTAVTSLSGEIPVRPGTDMIEIRGVINSPLLGFDDRTGCEPCTDGGCSTCQGTTPIRVAATTQNQHVNHDATNRPQFSQIDDYTGGAGPGDARMMVLVTFNDEVHVGCTFNVGVLEYSLYSQPSYNVGTISATTTLAASGSFGAVNFTDTIAEQFNPETPAEAATAPQSSKSVRRAGILDDLIYFIDNSNPLHPALAQAARRGGKFDVVPLADDIEDMQIAYGADLPDANGITNNAIDSNEWSPDGTANQRIYGTNDFRDPVNRCPRLHGVMVSLVAKSHDPDPTSKMSPSRILPMMNSPVVGSPAGYPRTAQYSGSPGYHYRRRVQTLRINLRNYAYEGG